MKQIQSIFDVNIGDIVIYTGKQRKKDYGTPCLVIAINVDTEQLFVFFYSEDFNFSQTYFESHLRCGHYANFSFDKRFENGITCTMCYSENVKVKLNVDKVTKLEQDFEFEEEFEEL